MTTPRVNAGSAAGLLLLALSGTGCVERVIHDLGGLQRCGDGVPAPGEVCLGQGRRFTLTIEGIEGLLLRAADFGGDGHVDLLVVGLDPGGAVSIRLWPGRGDGDFEPTLDPGVRGCSAYAVAGDANGDPALDLLVDECGPSMSVLLGHSSGSFQGPVPVATGLQTRSSGLVDLDADGRREVIVLGAFDDASWGISVAERSDGGAYDPPVVSVGGTTDDFDPRGLGVLDVDRDGYFDALLVHPSHPDGLALARGGPGFTFERPMPVGPAGLVADTSMVRDLDEDDVPDVLAVSFAEEALVFLRSEGRQLVERGRTSVPDLRLGPAGAGDMDADGHLDLLLFEPGSRKLQAWLGRGDGSFEDPLALDLEVPIGQIALVDLDEDGALDIVAGTFESGTLQILLSDP
ncbi:MAG: VCBS repeat-containing protein [Myxococcales bacterium]|nr:VCBS repeat-containing protein [Myxococcales bacterium]